MWSSFRIWMSSRSPSSKKGKGVSPPLVSGGSSETVAGAAGPAQQCSIAIPITSSFSKPSNKQQGFRFSLRRMLYNSPLVSQRSRTLSLSGSNNVAPHSSSGASRSKKKQSPANRKSVFTILKHVFDPFILLQFVMNRKVHQQVMHQQDHSLKFEELEPPAPVIAL